MGKKKTKIVGVKEFRMNLEDYAKYVQAGGSVLVLRKSKPLFRLEHPGEGEWETVIDFTKIKKGVGADKILNKINRK